MKDLLVELHNNLKNENAKNYLRENTQLIVDFGNEQETMERVGEYLKFYPSDTLEYKSAMYKYLSNGGKL